MIEDGSPAELFELPPGLCRSLLTTQPVGRLVLCGPDPSIVPVNYALVDGGIVLRSEPGPRVDALEGRRVAFEVDDFDRRTHSGWSVVVRGRASEITLTVAQTADPAHWAVVQPWAPGAKACWIRIEPESITGRLLRGAVPPSWVDGRAYL